MGCDVIDISSEDTSSGRLGCRAGSLGWTTCGAAAVHERALVCSTYCVHMQYTEPLSPLRASKPHSASPHQSGEASVEVEGAAVLKLGAGYPLNDVCGVANSITLPLVGRMYVHSIVPHVKLILHGGRLQVRSRPG